MGPSPLPTETDLLVTQVFSRNAEQPPRFLALLEMLRMGLCHEHFRVDGQCWPEGLGNHQFPSVFVLPLEGDQAHWCGLLRRALFLHRLLPVLRCIRKGGNYSRRGKSSDRLCQVPEHRAGSSPQLKGSWSKFNKATGLGGLLMHSSTGARMPFAGK